MGWLSLLADLGLGVAAPFTGGASLAGIPLANAALNKVQGGGNVLTDVGSVLGSQQAGKSGGALAQAGAQQAQDRNAIANYTAQQAAQNQAAQTDLERQQYTTQNRGKTAQQALVGALLGGGYQPTHIGPVNPNTGGGLARSLLGSPQALAAGQTLNAQASKAQNTPLSFTGGNILTPPSLTPLPNIGSGVSNVASGLQLAGAAAPSFMAIMKRLQQQSPSAGPPVYPGDESLE